MINNTVAFKNANGDKVNGIIQDKVRMLHNGSYETSRLNHLKTSKVYDTHDISVTIDVYLIEEEFNNTLYFVRPDEIIEILRKAKG